MRSTWGPRTAESNVRKQGVTFEEATTVFADPLAMVIADAVPAGRGRIIGESLRRRVLLTVFAERHEGEIRIISARRATKRERRNYEQRQEAQATRAVQGLAARGSRG